jgi:hypothetical protein
MSVQGHNNECPKIEGVIAMFQLTYWANDTIVCNKDRQSVLPVVGDTVFLDVPSPAHYVVTARCIVYAGLVTRVDLFVTVTQKSRG